MNNKFNCAKTTAHSTSKLNDNKWSSYSCPSHITFKCLFIASLFLISAVIYQYLNCGKICWCTTSSSHDASNNKILDEQQVNVDQLKSTNLEDKIVVQLDKQQDEQKLIKVKPRTQKTHSKLIDPSIPHPNSIPIFPQPKPTPSSFDASFDPTFLSKLNKCKLDDFSSINPSSDHLLNLSLISTFNNIHISPRLQSIVGMDYFRFVKFNLQRKCSLWTDNSKCSLRDCGVQLCDESQLPKSIMLSQETSSPIHSTLNKLSEPSHDDDCPNDSPKKLSQINDTVSNENIETMNSLFECTEEDHDGQYVDLILNPERFTGYVGESAHRIWRSIYEENCFLQRQNSHPFSLDAKCYEERLFYRAISGLHTSINIHLCALYHIMEGTFAPNLNEMQRRFEKNPEYLKNLYFLYLLELRALHKAEPYLLNKVSWQSVGDQSLTKEAIKDLLKTVKKFKWHFNESILFKKQPPNVAQEFASHFQNITTNIMDCVACDKCKLWGKVQTHGLGTAFKILLTHNIDQLTLNRHEIICLVNALARLSNSITKLEVFQRLFDGKI